MVKLMAGVVLLVASVAHALTGSGDIGRLTLWESKTNLTSNSGLGYRTGGWMVGPYGSTRLSLLNPGGYDSTFFGELAGVAGLGGLAEHGRFFAYHVDNENFPMFQYGGYAPTRRTYAQVGGPHWGIFPPFSRANPIMWLEGGFGNESPLLSVRETMPAVADPNRFNINERLILTAESCETATRSVCTALIRNIGLQCNEESSNKQWDGTSGGCNGRACVSKVNESCGLGTWTGTPGTGGLRRGATYLLTYAFEDYDNGGLRNSRKYSKGNDVNCPSCIGGGKTRDSRQSPVAIPAGDPNGRGYKVKATLPKVCWAGDTPDEFRCAKAGSVCSKDADCGTGDFCNSVRKTCSTDSDCGSLNGGSRERCSEWPEGADRAIIYIAGGPQPNGATSVNGLRFRQNFIDYPNTSAYVYGAPDDRHSGQWEGEQPIEGINTTTRASLEVLQNQGPVLGLRQFSAGYPLALQMIRGVGYDSHVDFNLFPTSTQGIEVLRRSGTGDFTRYQVNPALGELAVAGVDNAGRYYLNASAGDQSPSFRARADGIEAGAGGAGAPDVALRRSSAGTWTSDGNLVVPEGKYLQAAHSSAGPPPSEDCASDSARGRLSIDTVGNLLYVCNGAERGWDSVALTN